MHFCDVNTDNATITGSGCTKCQLRVMQLLSGMTVTHRAIVSGHKVHRHVTRILFASVTQGTDSWIVIAPESFTTLARNVQVSSLFLLAK